MRHTLMNAAVLAAACLFINPALGYDPPTAPPQVKAKATGPTIEFIGPAPTPATPPVTPPPPVTNATRVLSANKMLVAKQKAGIAWNVTQPILADQTIFTAVDVVYVKAGSPTFGHIEGEPKGKQHVFTEDVVCIYFTGDWPDEKKNPTDFAATHLNLLVQALKFVEGQPPVVDAQQVISIIKPGAAPVVPTPVTPTPVTPTPVVPTPVIPTPVTPTPSSADPALVKVFKEALDRDIAKSAGSKDDAVKLASIYASAAAILMNGDAAMPKPATWKLLLEDCAQSSANKNIPRLPYLENLRTQIEATVGKRDQNLKLDATTIPPIADTFKKVAAALMEASK